jgi:hypothetical protein
MYASSNVIRVIIPKKMKLSEYVARMGEMRNVYNIFIGKPKGRGHLVDLGVYGRIILKWILGKSGGGKYVDWTHLAQDRD